MEKDMFGVSRLKVNLHMHTTLSDGSKTPEEAAEIYKKAGYDVVIVERLAVCVFYQELNIILAEAMPALVYTIFLA